MATQFEIDCALMAGRAYQTNRDPNGINWFPVPSGWNEYLHIPNNTLPSIAGFEMSVFQNTANPTEIVISFAGTNGDGGSILTNPDKQADAALGLGLWSDQLGQAAAYYLEVKAVNPGATISFTGHSLGGGLASLMAVFFGEAAFTFDQAPFQAALAQAQTLKNYLLTREAGSIDAATLNNLLAPLDRYITAADVNNPNPIASDTLAGRETKVTNINVQGEFLSTPPWNFLNRIGTPSAVIPNNTNGVSADDLHAQSLLAAFLQSNQTAAAQKGLNDVTFKITDLLGMIFDTNLFAHPTNDPKFENLLEHLVRHEAGVAADPVTGAAAITADAMVTRFTADLWKLAQDGGLTLSENYSYANWNNVSKALIAFAMQMYYEDTANAADPNKQLFTDLSTAGTGSNGVQFDMHDVSKDVAAAMDANAQVDLAKAKGYQSFQTYIDTTGLFSPAEKQLIKSLLPQLRDWYVQAGASGMTATDTLNRGAFMLGGTGSDALVGGTAADLLVGNAGDDILKGGDGSDVLIGGVGVDTYAWKASANAGIDTILDSDKQGYLRDDSNSPTVLTGGTQYGDNRVFSGKDANGANHLYTFVTGNRVSGGDLIVDGAMLIKGYNPSAGNHMGITLDGPVAPANLSKLTGNGFDNYIVNDVRNKNADPLKHETRYAEVDPGISGSGPVLEGNGGADIIAGQGGDDFIYSDTQIDTVTAITQGNTGTGGGQGDWLTGGSGNDTIVGSTGNDVLMGGGGTDLLIGGLGDDDIVGDTNWVASSFDWTVTDTVNGRLFKPAGGDSWPADSAADVIYAGEGNDHVWGDMGNDVIFGENGNDILDGDGVKLASFSDAPVLFDINYDGPSTGSGQAGRYVTSRMRWLNYEGNLRNATAANDEAWRIAA